MTSYAIAYPSQAVEVLDPELLPGDFAQLDYLSPWNTRDNLHQQQQHCDDGFNLTQYPVTPRSFCSYDGAAHGFSLTLPVKRSHPLSFQYDLDRMLQDDLDRRARYSSPLSSSTSLSGRDSTRRDLPMTPDAPKDWPAWPASDNAYPAPHNELYAAQSCPAYFQESPAVIDWNTAGVPSQPSFTMTDFELSPDEILKQVDGLHNTMPDSELSTDALNSVDGPKHSDSSSSSSSSYPDQHAGSETVDAEPLAQARPCNEMDFSPPHTSQPFLAKAPHPPPRTRRLASATSAHAVVDPKAHVQKSSSSRAKSKMKAGRINRGSSLGHTSSCTSKSKGRSFPCPFAAFGCESVFPTKNEWKRHTAAQHLQLGFFRCDLGGCSASHPDQVTLTKGHNDFNRKDLFTQHCRRMHWDTCEGLHRSKVKGKDWASWSNREKNIFESYMESVRQRCWVNRRGPPSKSECGVCGQVFADDNDGGDDDDDDSGATAWEEMMDHIGKHYERGEQDSGAQQDIGIREWCEENEMGAWIDGKYWLVGYEPQVKQEKSITGRLTRRNSPASQPARGKQETEQDEWKDDDSNGDDTDADGELELE